MRRLVVTWALVWAIGAWGADFATRARLRRLADDPATFEQAVKEGLASEDAVVRRWTLCQVWERDAARAVGLGRKMSDDADSGVQDFLIAIGAVEKKDDFAFYRDNVAVSQDPSEDHDFAVLRRFDLPVEGWRFSFDASASGHRGKTPFFAVDFDDTSWKTIAVNAQWELQGFPEFDGVAWYRLTFELPERPAGAELVELCVGAVDEDAWVWLNGTYLGQHVEGLSGWDKAFRFNAAKEIRWGARNQLTIRVFDSCNAGGIWRPVAVEVLK